MLPQDIVIVSFVVSVFAVFAAALGFASWDETRRMRAIAKSRPAPAPAAMQSFQLAE